MSNGINHWEMSRRTALKAAAALFAAYNLSSSGARAASGKSLNILNTNLLFCDVLAKVIPKVYTDAEITAEENPQNEHYEKLLVEMSQGSSTYDLLVLDNMFSHQFLVNKWVKAVDDIKADDPSLPPLKYENVAPASLKYLQYDGKSFGIPMTLSTPIFVYRKDLFEAKGLSVPTNWDDYRKCAEALHTDEVAGNILLLGGQDAHMSGDWATRLMSMTKLGPDDDACWTARSGRCSIRKARVQGPSSESRKCSRLRRKVPKVSIILMASRFSRREKPRCSSAGRMCSLAWRTAH